MKDRYLFRHPEPIDADADANSSRAGQDRCKGSGCDVALSPEGERQVDAIIDWIMQNFTRKELGQACVVTSGMRRTDCMGERLQERASVQHIVDNRFRDINVGQWEDRSWDDIKHQWPDLYQRCFNDARGLVLPDGDTVDAYAREMLNVWRDYVADSRALIFFCLHRVHNKIFLSDADGRVLHFKGQELGCMNHISITQDGKRIVRAENTIVYPTPVTLSFSCD